LLKRGLGGVWILFQKESLMKKPSVGKLNLFKLALPAALMAAACCNAAGAEIISSESIAVSGTYAYVIDPIDIPIIAFIIYA
jgi:hypothetical protein